MLSLFYQSLGRFFSLLRLQTTAPAAGILHQKPRRVHFYVVRMGVDTHQKIGVGERKRGLHKKNVPLHVPLQIAQKWPFSCILAVFEETARRPQKHAQSHIKQGKTG